MPKNVLHTFQSIDITGFREENFDKAYGHIFETLFVKFRDVCGSLEVSEPLKYGPNPIVHFRSYYFSLHDQKSSEDGTIYLDDNIDPLYALQDRLRGDSRTFAQYKENRVKYFAKAVGSDG